MSHLKKIIYMIILNLISLNFYAQPKDINIEFNLFKELFVETYWHTFSEDAIYNGRYEFADKMIVYNAQYLEKINDFIKNKKWHLSKFKPETLSENNQADYAIIENQLNKLDWQYNTFKEHTWNPAMYNLANIVGEVINSNYKTLEERIKLITKRLYKSKEYYEAAKLNIDKPTKPLYELAILQHKGAEQYFKEELPNIIESSSLTEPEKGEAKYLSLFAMREVMYYLHWLDSTKIVWETIGYHPFRIGEKSYEQKFKYDIYSSFTATEIYKQAQNDKENIHQYMYDIALQLWPKYFPEHDVPKDKLITVKKIINKVSEKHVSKEDFFNSVKNQIPELQEFVINNNLLTVHTEKPLVIRKMPSYMRGIAGASISPPGPYDKDGTTYYNVAPLDAYSDQEAESYLREYNDYMMQILNIHEAIPGHYVQLSHSNLTPSLVKSVFGNGAMIEGWAVYSERMMLENNYGNNQLELWLMYYKWNLRSIINTILDYSVHVLNMNKKDALDLLINQGFQEQTEADGKWLRVLRSQVQLTSYYTGYKEIYKLREDHKEKLGDNFNLKNFHDEFLSYGSAPVPIIRQLMKKSC